MMPILTRGILASTGFQSGVGCLRGYAPASLVRTILPHAGAVRCMAKKAEDSEPIKEKKPKRAPAAFNLFVKEKYPLRKAEHPSETLGGISKLLSQEWKTLSDFEKTPFQEASKAAKMQQAKKIAETTPVAKKRAPSAYNLFVKDQMSVIKAANPTMTSPAIMKDISSKWKAMSESDKDVYKARAKKV